MAKRKVDFGGVDEEIRSGQRSKHVPPGNYLLKILKGDWQEGPKADYIRWQFQIVKPEKHKGGILYTNTSLSKQALWNLRNLIHAALGKNVAGKAVNFDPESLHGKIICGVVDDDEYDNKIRSSVVDFLGKKEYADAGDTDDDEEEEEEEEVEESSDDEEEDLEDVEVEDL